MFKKIIKSTIILGAVGVVLGFALPSLAGLLGLNLATLGLVNATGQAALSYSPLWLGGYFGLFGAVNAAIDPIVNGIFSLFNGSGKQSQTEHMTNKGAAAAGMAHAPAAHGSADLAEVPDNVLAQTSTSFRDKVGGPRDAAASFQQRVDASRAESSAGQTIH